MAPGEYREGPLMVMSFERFTEQPRGDSSPRYHNFLLYFRDTPGLVSQECRATEHWQKFQELEPKLAAELTTIISELEETDLHDRLNTLEEDLYEAYKTMRFLGASDNDLMMG